MKRNVSVLLFKFRCNLLISGKIIKEMPGSVASGKHFISQVRDSSLGERKRYPETILVVFLDTSRKILG